MKNNTGTQSFNAGQYVYMKDNQSKPVVLPQKPDLNFSLPSSVTSSGDKGSSQGGDKNKQTDCIVR
ncbi:MAG: hypothetical protein HQL08_16300 [Nitrospirae bacterium]|nr:hypothetical protein [Nitrospirota bacterium]